MLLIAKFIGSLALSKGKITMFFLLEGLAKRIAFQEVAIQMKEQQISMEDIQEFLDNLNLNKK
ncbi:MAG: hypothetical protein HC880_16045 [Bacteroidia bacterium]|nr:hypothetical protein [Bacteroidia bacterium]